MPKNYFEGRQECTKCPDGIYIGDTVQIITKDKQGSKSKEDLVTGKVERILSKGNYYRNGIKVELETGEIGRVQYLLTTTDMFVIE